MAAIDFETTGLDPSTNEIIQVAVVPLDSDLEPHPDIRPFYTNVCPDNPEIICDRAMRVNGLDIEDLILHAPPREKVEQYLVEWFEAIDLPMNKRLVPMAHNWTFEKSFGVAWLGLELWEHIFHFSARDGMVLAHAINDRAAFAGEDIPFSRVGLNSLCKHFGIINENPHDALSDCLAEAKVYKALLKHELF